MLSRSFVSLYRHSKTGGFPEVLPLNTTHIPNKRERDNESYTDSFGSPISTQILGKRKRKNESCSQSLVSPISITEITLAMFLKADAAEASPARSLRSISSCGISNECSSSGCVEIDMQDAFARLLGQDEIRKVSALCLDPMSSAFLIST